MSAIPSLQKILVALDGSAESMVALETAVSLAAAHQAEVIGLFVEDINLLRLAELPFSREIVLTSADANNLNSQHMSQQLRAQANRAEQALHTAGEEAHVLTSFRRVRGHVPLSVVTASMDVDLLVLGRVSRPITRRLRLGSTAQAALRQPARAVLLTGKIVGTPPSVFVLFDGSEAGWQALRQAVAVTSPVSTITIVLTGGDEKDVERWRRETAVWLQKHHRLATYHHLPTGSITQLAALAHKEQCDLLVLGSHILPKNTEEAAAVLASLECALLLIRAGENNKNDQ